MRVLAYVRAMFARQRRSSGLANPADWLWEWALGGQRSLSGEIISPQSSLSVGAYFAAARAISEDVAKLPLKVFQRVGGGKQIRPDHPLYSMLHDEPNPEMTAISFRETLTGHALTYGNGYAEITRGSGGRATALYPIEPNRVTVMRRERTGELYYRVMRTKENSFGGYDELPAEDVLHIHGVGFDGIVGYSIAHYAREALGLAKSAEKNGAAFFGNGSRPMGVIKYPTVLDENAARRLRESWQKTYGGSENAWSTAVLEEGAEYQALGQPNKDAQWIESRQFSVDEIARWFRIPPHKIGSLARATFSNIEQQAIEYLQDTLTPWLVRWEQEIRRKLFVGRDANYFAEHELSGLLRGDAAARASFLASMFQNGVLSVDEMRALENLNPLGAAAGGEDHFVPANLLPLKAAIVANSPPLDSTGPDDDERTTVVVVPPVAGPEGMPGPAGKDGRDGQDRVVDSGAAIRALILNRASVVMKAAEKQWSIMRERAERARKKGEANELATKSAGEHRRSQVRDAIGPLMYLMADDCHYHVRGAMSQRGFRDAVEAAISGAVDVYLERERACIQFAEEMDAESVAKRMLGVLREAVECQLL